METYVIIAGIHILGFVGTMIFMDFAFELSLKGEYTQQLWDPMDFEAFHIMFMFWPIGIIAILSDDDLWVVGPKEPKPLKFDSNNDPCILH